jgi:hypothetical protein
MIFCVGSMGLLSARMTLYEMFNSARKEESKIAEAF